MKKIIAITCGVLATGLAVWFLVTCCKKHVKIFGRKKDKAKPKREFFVE